jgi:L-aspartate oxidase
MERFVDELLPRDVLSKKIKEQMDKDGTKHVWLSVAHLDSEMVKNRFPNIYKRCLEEGYDITKEPIPVCPAQHYFMGGVKVDMNSMTSMEHLYAAGETSCNGVHGANRLASNSLLESLVFAKRCANHIMDTYEENADSEIKNLAGSIDLDKYKDGEKLADEYKEVVLNGIKKDALAR